MVFAAQWLAYALPCQRFASILADRYACDQVFLNIGTHAAIPNVPGLDAAGPLTNIEALEPDYVPQHLIVLGGG